MVTRRNTNTPEPLSRHSPPQGQPMSSSLADQLLPLLDPIVARVRRDVSAIKGADGGMYKSDDGLTRARLLSHVMSGAGLSGGGVTRGAYLIKPGEHVCRAAVLDLDDHDGSMGWDQVVRVAARLLRASGRLGLVGHPWRSRGGSGVHIWYLWSSDQDARSVRARLGEVLSSCLLHLGTGGLGAGEVEVFPKQDAVPVGGYGNQVWLPLGGASLPLVDVAGVLDVIEVGRLAELADGGHWTWEMSPDVPVVERVTPEARVVRVSSGSLVGAALDSKVRDARDWLGWVKDYSYDRWLRVGMCLHDGLGGSDEGLALWEEWSLRGSGFEDGACLAKWSTFGKRVDGVGGAEGGSVLGLGSLKKWARDAGWVEDVAAGFEVLTGVGSGVGSDPVAQALPVFERDAEGRILPTTGNVVLALARPDITGYELAVDTFRDELMFAVKKGQWQRFLDVHYTHIKCALENNGRGFKPISRIEVRECVAHVADTNKFDSAQVWLNSLPWDGVNRIDNFLYDYWGAVDSEYTRAVSLYIWTALAGRVLDPGCQADMMPILVGDEGPGKTSVIRALVPADDYFCEVSFDEKDDNIARKLRGVLACEVAELRGLGTRDEESIYAFVTRRYEKWVPKFKEFTATFPRRSLLFGTTNDDAPLSKEGRRWLPFKVGARAGRSEDAIRIMAVTRDRDLLWAEARERWKAQGQLWQDAQRLGPAARAAFILTHPWEEQIASYLSDYVPLLTRDKHGKVFIPSAKIMVHGLNMGGRITGADGRMLAKVMMKLGYERATNGQERGWTICS